MKASPKKPTHVVLHYETEKLGHIGLVFKDRTYMVDYNQSIYILDEQLHELSTLFPKLVIIIVNREKEFIKEINRIVYGFMRKSAGVTYDKEQTDTNKKEVK